MISEEKRIDKYTVRIASKRVEKQLDALTRKEYEQISSKIRVLVNNPRPHGVKKLSDRVHRIRVGDHRIIYSVFDREKIILLDKIVRRSESTYKNI